MQERIHDYRDPDSSFDLNRKYLGIIDAGLYRGFDPVLSPTSMALTLEHTNNGAYQYSIELIQERVGVIVTPHGVVIKENAPLVFNIVPETVNDRWDAIVLEHQFVESVGGVQGLYFVVQGVPALSPVKPPLTQPSKQILLGYLKVIKNATNVAAGVYEKAEAPVFSNNSSLYNLLITNVNSLQAADVLLDGRVDFLEANALLKNNNLSDVQNVAQVLTNLGITALFSTKLDKAANLNDVANKPTARINLGVYSQAEVDSLIADAINDLINGSPVALDTLIELANALGNDPNFATTIMTLLGDKVDKIAGYGLSKNDFTDLLLAKLNGIAANANYYIHPSSENGGHPAENIVDSSARRFVSDAEKDLWNDAVRKTPIDYVTNYDTATITGFYALGDTATGRPDNYNGLVSVITNGFNVSQSAYMLGANTFYFRTKFGFNPWSTWSSLITTKPQIEAIFTGLINTHWHNKLRQNTGILNADGPDALIPIGEGGMRVDLMTDGNLLGDTSAAENLIVITTRMQGSHFAAQIAIYDTGTDGPIFPRMGRRTWNTATSLWRPWVVDGYSTVPAVLGKANSNYTPYTAIGQPTATELNYVAGQALKAQITRWGTFMVTCGLNVISGGQSTFTIGGVFGAIPAGFAAIAGAQSFIRPIPAYCITGHAASAFVVYDFTTNSVSIQLRSTANLPNGSQVWISGDIPIVTN